ncbi:hypothetical protein ASF54_06655 [Frondihabitans sp. Leaf304]|nr:hypothetical protein ASF54_06655 [Frondihabitans sp. Leaf304]
MVALISDLHFVGIAPTATAAEVVAGVVGVARLDAVVPPEGSDAPAFAPVVTAAVVVAAEHPASAATAAPVIMRAMVVLDALLSMIPPG